MLTYLCNTSNLQVLIMHWEDNVLVWTEQKSVPQSLKTTPKLRFAREEHTQKDKDLHSENPKNPKLVPVTFYIQQSIQTKF